MVASFLKIKKKVLRERIKELSVMGVSIGAVVTLLDAWENLVRELWPP
jgi:hypothetical protein